MAQRILVIDDTQEILDLFRVILEAEGYEVLLSTHSYENVVEIEHLHHRLSLCWTSSWESKTKAGNFFKCSRCTPPQPQFLSSFAQPL